MENSRCCIVRPDHASLRECVEAASRIADRPIGPTRLQALLQLPRLADSNATLSMSTAIESLAEIAAELPTRDRWRVDSDEPSPRGLHFCPVSAVETQTVMEEFHYLRSPREPGRAYGLFTKQGQLAALCVSSALDVPHIGNLLAATERNPETSRVISRVFAFEGAPTNSISYLLARSSRAEQKLSVSDIVTYVNPNMGFTGSSYRASNWQMLGTESGTVYRYLDSRYITQRRLQLAFGPKDDASLQRMLGKRFARSTMPLEPLLIFHYSLNER